MFYICIYLIFCRWKGENVATYEVSNVLTQLDIIHDANVYGVEIPGITYLIITLQTLYNTYTCI
jgi:hypothetical protein